MVTKIIYILQETFINFDKRQFETKQISRMTKNEAKLHHFELKNAKKWPWIKAFLAIAALQESPNSI